MGKNETAAMPYEMEPLDSALVQKFLDLARRVVHERGVNFMSKQTVTKCSQ